ncbi:hypothetical protein CRE_22473 [Caenorhabditis remanei]|uniref:Uncharacterized protein n=1 Tax=Caenorhabditis remanei TaxID=31234 RepID=E3MEF0_CAERE|nr:hypothetical protein CRE_22473 [Caenorhabditis remanei]
MSTNDDIKKAEELKTTEEMEKSRVKFNELTQYALSHTLSEEEVKEVEEDDNPHIFENSGNQFGAMIAVVNAGTEYGPLLEHIAKQRERSKKVRAASRTFNRRPERMELLKELKKAEMKKRVKANDKTTKATSKKERSAIKDKK